MASRDSRHGELLIDNRVAFDNAPPEPGLSRFVEGKTFTCSHCHRQILKDPDVEIPWCFGCNRYLCNRCKTVSMVAGCKPFEAVIEKYDRHAHRGLIL